MDKITKSGTVLKTRGGEQILIRVLSDGDVVGLQNFHAKLSEQTRSWFFPHKYDEETISRYVERVKNDLDHIFVALFEQEIIGYIFLWNIQEPFPLLGIGITDAYQGLGLGKQMMKILIDDAKATGCAGIELTTALDNDRAFQLYQKMGFQYIRETENIAGDGSVVRERMMFMALVPGASPEKHDFKPPV